MEKTFARILYPDIFFSYPGIFFSGVSIVEVPNNTKLDTYTPPKGAYGFCLFKRTVTTTPVGEVLEGKDRDHTAHVYYGEEFNEERVKREVRDNEILLSNMRCDGWKRVLRCRQGFIPLEPGDIVRPPRS